MMKKLIEADALEIFRNNNELQNRVYYDALENDSYFLADEILSYFRHYNEALQRRYDTLADYEIDNCRAYVKVNTNYLKDFITDCLTVADIFAAFPEDLTETIKRVNKKIDLYEDAAAGYYDMSDYRFFRLKNWIHAAINEACQCIALYAQESYTQFDDPGILEDYFLTIWLECNNDLQVDDAGTVYETITTVKSYK